MYLIDGKKPLYLVESRLFSPQLDQLLPSLVVPCAWKNARDDTSYKPTFITIFSSLIPDSHYCPPAIVFFPFLQESTACPRENIGASSWSTLQLFEAVTRSDLECDFLTRGATSVSNCLPILCLPYGGKLFLGGLFSTIGGSRASCDPDDLVFVTLWGRIFLFIIFIQYRGFSSISDFRPQWPPTPCYTYGYGCRNFKVGTNRCVVTYVHIFRDREDTNIEIWKLPISLLQKLEIRIHLISQAS